MLSNTLVIAGCALIVLGILGLVAVALLAWLERRRAAANPTWFSPLAEIIDVGDPLSRELSAVELAPAHLFDEINAAYPIDLDWQPLTFTQQWSIAGERLREMGDTQTFAAVAA